MQEIRAEQLSFFSKNPGGKFPSTRFQGSKTKLCGWIWDNIKDLEFETCLDAFAGTGSLAYRLKQAGKQVTYNDLLRFNYHIGRALIENSDTLLPAHEIEWLLERQPDITYPSFIADTFSEIYFTDEENAWLDQTITNIRQLDDPYKAALAFFALGQACIIKRPFNLFHRKNLYIRFGEVERSFGNKTTWDKPFENWFRVFIAEANQAVFDNGKKNYALNKDACTVPGEYDLVYIDTPYISKRGGGVDYLDFYHFLEGLTMYDEWPDHIDYSSKHLRFKRRQNEWTNKKQIYAAFDRLFNQFRKSILVVSYRSDGIPSETELVSLLMKYKKNVQVKHYGQYQYVLSKNSKSEELLLISVK